MDLKLHGGPWILPMPDLPHAPMPTYQGAGEIPQRCWVIIEVGAKQAFIFASNRRRANAGASALIGERFISWVREAIARFGTDVDPVVPVVHVSGLAVLLVSDPDQGRAIVGEVTERAYREAPGLIVWGAVHDVTDDASKGLRETFDELRRVRVTRPAPAELALRTPYTAPCQLTGQAAAAVVKTGGQELVVSAQMDACLTAGKDNRFSFLPGVQVNLDKDLAEHWVAVIHADGNGFGAVFKKLAERECGSVEYVERYRALSQAIEKVTTEAVQSAATALHQQIAEETGKEPSEWWLPLIIAGDDVTALMDGRFARQFTVMLLEKFAALASQDPAIRSEFGTSTPTMSAGIAYIKPHFPFHQAYDLAEELCSSAKTVPASVDLAKTGGSIDFLVLHDSVARSLGDLRRTVSMPDLDLPVVQPWADVHGIKDLTQLIRLVGKSNDMEGATTEMASSSLVHEIRFALASGNVEVLKKARRKLPHELDRRVLVADDIETVTSWLDAMTVADVERA